MSRIFKTSEFLMSQFMLVMSQQFTTVHNYTRTKVPSFCTSLIHRHR